MTVVKKKVCFLYSSVAIEDFESTDNDESDEEDQDEEMEDEDYYYDHDYPRMIPSNSPKSKVYS
jgi:hypothetical protein